jgi:hypothetical protein
MSLSQKMALDISAMGCCGGSVNRENVMQKAHMITKQHFGCGRARAFTYKDMFTYCLRALYNVIKIVEAGARVDFEIIVNYLGRVSWDYTLITRKSYYDTICIMGDYLKIIKGSYTEKAFIAARNLCENCGLYLSQNI